MSRNIDGDAGEHVSGRRRQHLDDPLGEPVSESLGASLCEQGSVPGTEGTAGESVVWCVGSPLLQCRDMSLQAGRRLLIASLDWRVEQGDFWCVLGPNGVGKSTLLYTLAGVLAPASGSLEIEGKAISSWSLPALARTRGLMAQQQVDAFSATVLDTVLIGRTPYRLGNRGNRGNRGSEQRGAWNGNWESDPDLTAARDALATVGMASFAQTDVLQLSGGERQRVALATLLAQTPSLMLLDEPTSHQDVAHQLAVMRQIRLQVPRRTVIATTHDINLAERFATHVLMLAPGCTFAGPVNEILMPDNLKIAFGCQFRVVADGPHRTFTAF